MTPAAAIKKGKKQAILAAQLKMVKLRFDTREQKSLAEETRGLAPALLKHLT